MAGHEHKWGRKRKGTAACTVEGCHAVVHTHTPAANPHGVFYCSTCGAYMPGPAADARDINPDTGTFREQPDELRARRPLRAERLNEPKRRGGRGRREVGK